MPVLQDPMSIFTFYAGVCAAVFWSTRQPWSKKFYRIIPSIILIYYLPTFATTFGIIPSESPVYNWIRDYLLPFSLFILMVTADIPTILKIGPKAIIMMVVGTLGIVIGGPVAFLLFEHRLPPETWKGLAALSGSWIGGGANFAAIKESVGAPDSIIGPIIIVDTAVGYTWMGVLLFLANYQKIIDRWNRASSAVLEDINHRLQDFQESQVKPITLADTAIVLAIGFFGAVVCRNLGQWFDGFTQPILLKSVPQLASIFTGFTWMVIFITFLFIGARLIKAPLFLLAIGSQANVGGAASAPVVAAAYYESMAPVGLLMGVMGYLLGNYAGLLCAFLLRLVGE
ncbi:MAG: DUF819 domain-containing protein [bacterium]